MTPHRYRTTWHCSHCPCNITVYCRIDRIEHPPTHPCKLRMGRRYPLVLVDDEPPEAA